MPPPGPCKEGEGLLDREGFLFDCAGGKWQQSLLKEGEECKKGIKYFLSFDNFIRPCTEKGRWGKAIELERGITTQNPLASCVVDITYSHPCTTPGWLGYLCWPVSGGSECAPETLIQPPKNAACDYPDLPERCPSTVISFPEAECWRVTCLDGPGQLEVWCKGDR